MEAKDTVMTLAEINKIRLSKSQEGIEETVTGWCKIIAQAQAEISFKAGQLDQAAFDQINFDKERIKFHNKIAEAKQAGIKEVTEFVNQFHNGIWFRIPEFHWQSQVKGVGTMTEQELIEEIFKEIEGGIYQFIENETCYYECKDFLANLKGKWVKEALRNNAMPFENQYY